MISVWLASLADNMHAFIGNGLVFCRSDSLGTCSEAADGEPAGAACGVASRELQEPRYGGGQGNAARTVQSAAPVCGPGLAARHRLSPLSGEQQEAAGTAG